MPAVTDLEGFTYLQKEGNGVLLGVYERNPRHWKARGCRLGLRPDPVPREARPHHARALDRLRALPRARGDRHQPMGERRVHVHARRQPARRPGGRPPELLGGVRVHGRLLAVRRRSASPSRTGSSTATPATTCSAWTSRASAPSPRTTATCARRPAQFYARRFVMAYPNEELPAGRPLKTTPCYDELLARGARFAVNWGLEVAALLRAVTPDFERTRHAGALQRAEPIVAEEVEAVRDGGGRLRDRAVRALRGAGPGPRRGSIACWRPPPGSRRDQARADAQRGRTADGGPHRRDGSTTTGSGSRAPTTCRTGTCAGSTRTCRPSGVPDRERRRRVDGLLRLRPGIAHDPGELTDIDLARGVRVPRLRRWTSVPRGRWSGASR